MRSENEHVCFVISPIGGDGTEVYSRFKEVLDFVIKPAVESSGYKLTVVRADNINRAGSFIKDILQQLLDSHIVIADLTTQNPNVFYELGVRHSLSPRTILIAQSADDIPSDLREYRTIVYDTSARGAAMFRERLQKYLKDIFTDPHRSDNPVMDRLGSMLERQTAALHAEIKSLKQQLDRLLKTGRSPASLSDGPASVDDARTRVARILKLENAELQYLETAEIDYDEGDKVRSAEIPSKQGPFTLYFRMTGETIGSCWYVAIPHKMAVEQLLADVRVLMGAASTGGLETACLFIIATNQNFSGERTKMTDAFQAMKKFIPTPKRKLFDFDLWDNDRLTEVETQLGIRVIPPKRRTKKNKN